MAGVGATATPGSTRTDLGRAWGAIAFGLGALLVLGPTALFLTWWGDCFQSTCPAPTANDLMLYRLDVVLWLVAAGATIMAVWRRSRRAFLLVGVIGSIFAAEGLGGFLGWRGGYAFPLIIPGAAMMIIGSLVGRSAVRAEPPTWAVGRAVPAMSVGCLGYAGAYFLFFGGLALSSGHPSGAALIALVVLATVILLAIVVRGETEVDRLENAGGRRGHG